MINKVLKTIKKHNMLSNNDNIVLGLSGGSDSVTLFHILRMLKDEYNLNLTVVHVNHGLRSEAIEDENFCISLCKKYNIPIHSYKIDINKLAKEQKITTEEAGRLARYECFNKHIKSKADKIAVAHNKNDVAETFLMRLFRGAGLRGLSSILPVRDNIIRPLIDIEKSEIEDFCTQNSYPFIFDKSNLSCEYTRNKIRLNLLPNLKEEYNQDIINSIYKTSKLLNEEDNYLNTISLDHFYNIAEINSNSILINIEELNKLDIVIQRRVIRHTIYHLNNNLKDLSFEHIMQSLNLCNVENGKSINLPSNLQVIKEYSNLRFFINNIEEKKNININLNMSNIHYIENKNLYITLSFQEVTINNFNSIIKNYKTISNKTLKCTFCKQFSTHNYNNFNLRYRKTGDKIYFRYINGNKKLKKYFIDNKVPRLERDSTLLLANDENIFIIFDEQLKIADYQENMHNVFVQLWEEEKK